MGILGELKLSNVQRNVHLSPVLQRRNKLVASLHNQLQLATSLAEGKTYEIAGVKRYKNAEGEVIKTDVMRKVKPWFFISENGKAMMQVKYGTKVLELAKNKSSIEIASPDKLIPTIEQLKKAVIAGELDAHIEAVLK